MNVPDRLTLPEKHRLDEWPKLGPCEELGKDVTWVEFAIDV
jgi:hypothetical protein